MAGYGRYGRRYGFAVTRSYDRATRDLIDRMTNKPNNDRIALFDSVMFRPLKNAGVLDLVNGLWIATADKQAAYLNWTGDHHNLVEVGTPTLTANSHFQGDGLMSCLETGYLYPAAYQNSAHLSSYCLDSGANVAALPDMGNVGAALIRHFGPDTFARLNHGLPAYSAVIPATAGVMVVSRTGPAIGDLQLYKDGDAITLTGGSTSTVPEVTFPVRLLGRNGAVPTFSNKRYFSFSVGRGLTEAQSDVLTLALQQLRAGIAP